MAETIVGRGSIVSVRVGAARTRRPVFVTSIETAALNRVYHEAEAILLAGWRNRAL